MRGYQFFEECDKETDATVALPLWVYSALTYRGAPIFGNCDSLHVQTLVCGQFSLFQFLAGSKPQTQKDDVADTRRL